MTNIGFQEPRTEWIRRFVMVVLIGSAIGACNVKEDVVFVKVDASDADNYEDNDAGSNAGNDAGNDGEKTISDSGNRISESGLNDWDVTIPGREGGIDNTTWPSPLPRFECPDESSVFLVDDKCVYDLSFPDLNTLLIFEIGERVDSIDDCIPSDLPYLRAGFEISAEDFETTVDNPFSRSPCPQLCEAAYTSNLQKLGKILRMSRFYYVDPNDEDVLVACPLTCELRRCYVALLIQLDRILLR